MPRRLKMDIDNADDHTNYWTCCALRSKTR